MSQEEPQNAKFVTPALLVAVTAISFAAIFFKKASPTHPLVSAGIRLAVAAVLLTPMALRSWKKGLMSASLVRSAVIAGLLYGVHFGTWVTSLTLTSIASSVTLVTATPLILAFIALATGHDKPDPKHWWAIGLAVCGITIIGSHDSNVGVEALMGDALAFGGAAAMAGYMLVGRRLGDAMDIWSFGAIATAVGATSLLGTAWFINIPIQVASSEALMYLVLAALVPQLIGHNLLTWTLRYTRPTIVGIATVGEPVGAAFLGWIWLHEQVGTTVAFGCTLTIAAVLLSILGSEKRPAQDP
jgi:drug/metabolite transporter (DMT)-like permease